MMSVVQKSTCSGFKTKLYISYHSGNALRYINLFSALARRCLSGCRDGGISDYFDTIYLTVQNKIYTILKTKKCNFFKNLEQVNFRVTLVIYGWQNVDSILKCLLAC